MQQHGHNPCQIFFNSAFSVLTTEYFTIRQEFLIKKRLACPHRWVWWESEWNIQTELHLHVAPYPLPAYTKLCSFTTASIYTARPPANQVKSETELWTTFTGDFFLSVCGLKLSDFKLLGSNEVSLREIDRKRYFIKIWMHESTVACLKGVCGEECFC